MSRMERQKTGIAHAFDENDKVQVFRKPSGPTWNKA